MTNFERIKQMTVEEMALFLTDLVGVTSCEDCPSKQNVGITCDDCFERYLESEAEDD